MEDERSVGNEEKKEKDADAIEAIARILYGENGKNVAEKDSTRAKERRRRVLRAFRLLFAKSALEDKINSLDVGDLLDVVASAEKDRVADRTEFLLDYCHLLLDLLNGYEKLRSKVVPQIEWTVKELSAANELPNHLAKNIWLALERSDVPSTRVIRDILHLSKEILEEVVFQWVVDVTESTESAKDVKSLAFYSAASSHCGSLFETISRILNQFVVLTNGNDQVLKLVAHYVQSVTEKCNEAGKSIFGYYPRKYFRLLSLLSVPPFMCSNQIVTGEESTPLKVKILDLISNNFEENQGMTLLLLTHHPNWLSEFCAHIEEREATSCR